MRAGTWLTCWKNISRGLRRRPTGFRPVLEGLEGRDLPSYAVASTVPVDFGPVHVRAGDFDGDHKTDLVVTFAGISASTNVIGLLRGNGNGTFAPMTVIYSEPHGGSFGDVAVGDLNGDRKLDIVGAHAGFGLSGDGSAVV